MTLTTLLPSLRRSVPAASGPARLAPAHATATDDVAHLPRDLRAGDLLALPCTTPTALYDVLGAAGRLDHHEDPWSTR